MYNNQNTEIETFNGKKSVDKDEKEQKDKNKKEIENEEKKNETINHTKDKKKEVIKEGSRKELKEEINKKEKNIDSLIKKVINVVEDESISNQSSNDKKVENEIIENRRMCFIKK